MYLSKRCKGHKALICVNMRVQGDAHSTAAAHRAPVPHAGKGRCGVTPRSWVLPHGCSRRSRQHRSWGQRTWFAVCKTLTAGWGSYVVLQNILGVRTLEGIGIHPLVEEG